MLKNLQKFFKQEGVQVEMTTETVEATQGALPEVEAMAAELTEMKASFAQVSEALSAAQEEVATLKAALEQANAAVAAEAEQKAAAEAAALQAKMDARMAKIVETVGTVKAEGLMEATKELNDEAFDKIVGAMSANIDVEAKSEMFSETGVDAQPKAHEEKKPVHFKNFIKTK